MTAKTTTTSTSPSSGSSPVLRKLQHWSGIAFSVFASLHVATTISASLSPSQYDSVLNATRKWYRPSMAIEGLVVFAPLALHMIANTLIFMTTTTEKPIVRSFWKKLHTYSGYALGGMVPLHLFGTRFMHSYAQEFASLNYVLEKEMGFAVGMSYFVVLLSAGVYHSLYGLNVALGYKMKQPLVLASIVGVLAAGYFGLLGFAGYLYPELMTAVREKHSQFAAGH
ncbi:hypothetical protein C9374_014190 [Naegleria lovaniensis]|uniref:Uncharacterized protein n=1 Tax=Naegleria lovaniensis TaxID=51637 RepID=A0AA88GVD8_NAELO|nr:uncharacterized protein C9374_014190 [Naegleria lovaniensis]KAG2389630.1 hypothetical protein C9374_014190 [Naegleria lovaniensis]